MKKKAERDTILSEKILRIGLIKFVLFYGVLGWGLTFALFFSLGFTLLISDLYFMEVFPYAIIVFPFGGLVWSFGVWYTTSRHHNKHRKQDFPLIEKQGSEHSSSHPGEPE